MDISTIAKITSAELLNHGAQQEVLTITLDSRRSTGSPAELFVALPGAHHDGHDFINFMYSQGTRSFLVSKKFDLDDLKGANVLLVEDGLTALQQLAAHHRAQYQLPVIGITGSNGKTIVKEWLCSILEKQWQVVKSPKSYNSQVGVPLSVWQIEATHQVGVFEAGISLVGEMERLAAVIAPEYGIFTNLGSAHDEGFSNLTEKAAEKAKLFAHAKKVICRFDHDLVVQALQRGPAKTITWGINKPEADYNYQREGDRFTISRQGANVVFDLKFQNPYDLENILHAVTMAIELGEEPDLMQQAISQLKSVPMRLELKRGSNDTFVLDDSYNNDLQGLRIALEYMLQQPRKQKKTVVLSDILQSGKQGEVLYREINALLEKHQVTRLIGIGQEITKWSSVFTMQGAFYPSTEDLLKQAPDFSNEIILVKGARAFALEKVVKYLEEKSHGTVLEVNFEALTHNLNLYRKKLSPGVRLMVMVKAFAYGVGVEEIAHLLEYHKVDYLGVAYLDEAIYLRKKGIRLPIMIMNPEWENFSLLSTFDVEPEIYSLEMLNRFLDENPAPPPIHLKIETGMNRLGINEGDLPQLVYILQANPQLHVAGIFTHFSSADNPAEDAYTEAQADRFEEAYTRLSKALGYRPIKHVLNSAGIVRWPGFQFDMVRLGIGLYGYDSSGQEANLRPISKLKTRISQVKTVKAGDSIGYSRKGRVVKDGVIATLAIGYADGYGRIFGNGRAYVTIRGQKAYTIGNVCMDMTMIDVTGLDVKPGDEVIVFGDDPSIVDLAAWADTIPYEILTNVSQRVKRIFVSE